MSSDERYTKIAAAFLGSLKGFLAGVLTCTLAYFLFGRTDGSDGSRVVYSVERDTIVTRDTLIMRSPVEKTKRIVGAVKVPRADVIPMSEDVSDSIITTDSIDITITQKMYEDSCYKAWVSGYMVSLDSIVTYGRNSIVTVKEKVNTPLKRVHFGLQGGVGMTPKGVQPYIGLGISVVL